MKTTKEQRKLIAAQQLINANVAKQRQCNLDAGNADPKAAVNFDSRRKDIRNRLQSMIDSSDNARKEFISKLNGIGDMAYNISWAAGVVKADALAICAARILADLDAGHNIITVLEYHKKENIKTALRARASSSSQFSNAVELESGEAARSIADDIRWWVPSLIALRAEMEVL